MERGKGGATGREEGEQRASRSPLVPGLPPASPSPCEERLQAAERIYADVKAQRESLVSADTLAREAAQRAERTSSDFRRATDAVRRLEDRRRGGRSGSRGARATRVCKVVRGLR